MRSEESVGKPLRSSTSASDDSRTNRQSLRLRPSEHLENAGPPSPLRDTSLPTEPVPTTPKMSLFNLFSRPKFEKQRGYAERGIEVHPALPSKDLRQTASSPNLLAHVQQANNESSTQPPTPSTAATAPLKPKSRLKFTESTKPGLRESKNGPFEPPPLFQAYPQSMKDGCLEVSTMSVQTAIHKSKGKKADTTDEDSSIDARRTRSALKHANGVGGHVELPQKIFVLVTSGYLLQYAETGPANRLPEKILHLGSDSAAFASDLVPGRHHVLQVSQAVNQEGGLVASSASFLSKIGLRSAAVRRMTSSFLLVMPSAKEMEIWMTAIRREIVALGGKEIEHDPAKKIPLADAGEMKKTPSHRYQVKRNPSKVERLTSPTQASTPASFQQTDDGDSDSDTATLDGIEMEASKLDRSGGHAAARKRAPSDVPSISSSACPSLDQSQLNNIRSSESNSVRTSHTSQAGSPPTERPIKEALAEAADRRSPPKPNSRLLASYSMNWRRSGVPLALQKSGTLPPVLNVSPGQPKFDIIEESSPHSTTSSPKKTLTGARSEPNLHSASRVNSKRDSEVQVPPPVPSLSNAVAASSPWQEITTEAVPAVSVPSPALPARRRTSLQPLVTQQLAVNQASTRTVDANRGKRISFSMPLKINPSGVHAQPNSTVNSRRASQSYGPDAPGDSPTIHTLSAKVDALSRASSYSQRPSAPPSIALPNPPSAKARYSHVPAPIVTSPVMPTRPAPSPTNAQIAAGFPLPRSNTAPLQRPASLQVRSDMAPFLSSARSPQTGQIDARAIPIRGMKPSRSASNVGALATHHENARKLRPTTPTVPEEMDRAMPLPDRAMSPLPPRPGSRTSTRRSLKTRSSLPELDFGIPVVGLGPPAPPPNAPLPLPPPSSRPTSPSPVVAGHGSTANGIEAVAGLGIRV